MKTVEKKHPSDNENKSALHYKIHIYQTEKSVAYNVLLLVWSLTSYVLTKKEDFK